MSRDGVVGGASVIYILQRHQPTIITFMAACPGTMNEYVLTPLAPPLHCVIYILRNGAAGKTIVLVYILHDH